MADYPQAILPAFDILKNDPNFTPQRSADWFNKKVKMHIGDKMNVLKHLGDNLHTQQDKPMLGTLCSFFYAPKGADDLPYFDSFPLLLPFEFDGKYFTGLNLHYIPPMIRYKLLERLAQFTTDKKYDEKTKLKLSWQLLSQASMFPEVQPCVKKYIFSGKHVKSKFMVVAPSDWKSAVFLPTERMKKATKEQVWQDSMRKIKRIKKS